MMGLPIPINMIFPKIQEEFKKIIEVGDFAGLVITVEREGVKFDFKNDSGIFITPDMSLEELKAVIEGAKEVFNNGE